MDLRNPVVLHSRTEQTSPSMSAMTSGSIGTSSINIRPVGEHSEERTSDLTVVQKFL